MEKYTFKSENQSPWLVDIYNQFLPYKTDGFLVEIGVGHTIKGIDFSKHLPSMLVIEIDKVSPNRLCKKIVQLISGSHQQLQ